MTFYKGQRAYDRYHGALELTEVFDHVIREIMNPVNILDEPRHDVSHDTVARNGSVMGLFQR